MRKIKNIFFYLLVTIFLFISFSCNYTKLHTSYGTGSGKYADWIDSWSEYIVRDKIIDDFAEGGKNSKGFLLFSQDFFKGDYRYKGNEMKPYLHQFGLQGRVYSLLAKALRVDTYDNANRIFDSLREINAFLLASVLGLFILAAKREFGVLTALILAALLSVDAGLVLFSKNLYWASFTFLLPFCFFWYFYPRIRNSPLIYITVPFFVFLKSLNGYEALTCVVLSAIIPVVYYELKFGSNKKYLVHTCLMILLSSILGFLIALTIHFFSISGYLGSFKRGAEEIARNIVNRNLSFNWQGFFRAVANLANTKVSGNVFAGKAIKFYMLIPLLAGYYLSRRKFIIFDFILLFSFISTISWFIFGYSHSSVHTWFFYLTINLCFLPILSLYFARIIAPQLSRLTAFLFGKADKKR